VVAAEQVGDFQRDGAVCVRGAFTAEEVALLERGIGRNLAEPSERAIVASRPDDPGRFFEDFRNWQRIPEFERVIRTSEAAAIAAALMGSHRVRLHHDHLLVKEGCRRAACGAGRRRPAGVDARVRRGVASRPLADAADVHGRPGEVVPRVAGLERPADARPLRPRRGALLQRRRGQPRRPARRGGRAPRDWVTSPDFPGLADTVPTGAPFDHPLFPVLWDDATPSE
jgi:hypothetical protein